VQQFGRVVGCFVGASGVELKDYCSRRLGEIMNNLGNDGSARVLGKFGCGRALGIAPAIGVIALAAACAGGGANTPQTTTVATAPSAPAVAPASAAPKPTPAPSASTSAAPSASATAAASPPAPEMNESTGSSAPAASAAAPEPEPARPASEALTASKVAFVLDYANSDAKAKAVAACEKDPKQDDPEVKSACLQKARSKFLADVMVFHKGKKDNATLTIYKRNQSELKEVFVAPVVFENVTPHSVQLKFKGGRGQRPLFRNTGSPTLNLPNDYSLEIDDAEYGKLRYDAKVGLVDK